MVVVERRRGGPKRRKEPFIVIYLASTSPRRKRILKASGIAFKIVAPDYEENGPAHFSPSRTVKEHALGKARSVVGKISDGIVIGCDTIVYFRKKIIGKPKNLKDAFRILGALQGRRHSVYTGVAVLRVAASQIRKKTVFYEKTDVYLKKMSRGGIARYFRRMNPLDKAGAYAIQSRKQGIVAKVKGSFLNAVGLPAECLRDKIGSNLCG